MKEKQKDYNALANLLQILANPTRLKILDILSSQCSVSKTGCCVCDINKNIKLPQPYISKHLKILKDKKILQFKREGNKIFYSFNKNEAFNTLVKYLSQYKNCC